MKKISITDSEKKLLFVVLALAILACTYFFYFTKTMEAAQAIEKTNVNDASTVATLEGMVEKQDQTQKETEQFKKTIAEIIEKYPVGIPQEKAIYLIQQMQDTIEELDITSVSFSMNNLVMNFTGDNAPSGRYVALSFPFSATYSDFKTLLQYIASAKDRSTSPVVSAAFDESTGQLSGNVTYKLYYLTNTDKPYEDFPPTEIESGVENIFGTGDGTE